MNQFFALFDPVAEDEIYKRISQHLCFRKHNTFHFVPTECLRNKRNIKKSSYFNFVLILIINKAAEGFFFKP